MVAFVRELPHGLCTGVRIPEADAELSPDAWAQLDPAEARYAAGLAPTRHPTWVSGRVALRLAARHLGISAPAFLPNRRGAPEMPRGLVGSISHTRSMAVALIAEDTGWTVGIDIERRALGRQDISRHVLTESEQAEIAHLTSAQRGESIMVRFSLKESIYKAIDPFLQRYVGFREAQVSLLDDGQALVRLSLKEGGPLMVEGWWSTSDGFVLTSARARPG